MWPRKNFKISEGSIYIKKIYLKLPTHIDIVMVFKILMFKMLCIFQWIEFLFSIHVYYVDRSWNFTYNKNGTNCLPLQGPNFYPTCSPLLPTDEILEHPVLYKVVLDLSTLVDNRTLFAEPGEGDLHGAT